MFTVSIRFRNVLLGADILANGIIKRKYYPKLVLCADVTLFFHVILRRFFFISFELATFMRVVFFSLCDNALHIIMNIILCQCRYASQAQMYIEIVKTMNCLHVYMFDCLWCAPCIYSLFNGMEWFDWLRCCWEIDEMRRTVCDDNSIHVVLTHI